MDALSVEPPTRQEHPKQWVVEGVTYGKRADANKALAASLGTYTNAQRTQAQRQHGLR